MNDSEKARRFQDESTINISEELLINLSRKELEGRRSKHIFVATYDLWSIKKAVDLRGYWRGKKTFIFEIIEIKWKHYTKENLIYPHTSFSKYLLTEKWGSQCRPESVELEIKIWMVIKDKIFQ